MNNKILIKSLHEIELEKPTPVIKIAETVTKIVRENYYEDEVEVESPLTLEVFGETKITLDEFEKVLELDSPGATRDKILYDALWGTSHWAGRPQDLARHFRTTASEDWEIDTIDDNDKIALRNFADILDQRPDGLIGVHDNDWDSPIEFTITDESLDALVAHYLVKIRGEENVPNTDEVVYPEGEHFSHESLLEKEVPHEVIGATNEAQTDDEGKLKNFLVRVKVVVMMDILVDAKNADEAYDIVDKQVDNAKTRDELFDLGDRIEDDVVSIKIVEDE